MYIRNSDESLTLKASPLLPKKKTQSFKLQEQFSASTENLQPLKVPWELENYCKVRWEYWVETVKISVGQSLKKNIRGRSQELVISLPSLCAKDKQCRFASIPHKIQIQHKLIPGDKVKKVIMCLWFHDKTELNPCFLNDIWFSDEADFLLPGHANSKNSIFWGTTAPNEILLRPLHSKCTAWVPMSKHGINGSFLLEDENEEPLTVIKKSGSYNSNGLLWTVKTVGEVLTCSGEIVSGSSRMRLLFIQSMWPWSGSISDSHKYWSVDAEILSRDPDWSPHSPDLIPPPQTSTYRGTWRIMYMRTSPRQSLNDFASRLQVCLQWSSGHLEHILQCPVKVVKTVEDL